MKRIIWLFSFIVIGMFVLSSCKNEDGSLLLFPDESVPPVIATSSNTESFSYSIVGTKYTKQEVYDLKVVSDTVKYSFATTSLTSGQMEVIVELKNGSKMISRSISGIIAAADYKKLNSPLSKVTFNYSNFTGQFSFTINNAF